jgi:Holliday junction resolvase RusA-like endonuclease
MWSVTVYGTPKPKGSMVPFIDRATKQARLKEDATPALKAWRKLVAAAGRQVATKSQAVLITGPLQVELTITLEPPKVKPEVWPWKRVGDVDKLARAVLDSLTDSGVIGDDAQICRLTATKCYPDTPGVPDRLDRPGAVIRIGPIDDQPVALVIGVDPAGKVQVDHGGGFVLMTVTENPGEHRAAIVLPPTKAFALARALDHEARHAQEAVLI